MRISVNYVDESLDEVIGDGRLLGTVTVTRAPYAVGIAGQWNHTARNLDGEIVAIKNRHELAVGAVADAAR